MELAQAVEDKSTEDIIHLSARIGEIRNIYNSLGETFSETNEDDNED